MAYEKVKETLSVIPEEAIEAVSYESLGGEGSSGIEVRMTRAVKGEEEG
jgi:LETM1 and EF-hand domain-containing protein 1